MKKSILPVVLAALTLFSGLFTAKAADPNRMLVVAPGGNFKSTMIERVEAIEFRTVEEPVYTDITLGAPAMTSVSLTTTMSAGATSYLINCLPAVLAKQLAANPAGAFSYLKSINSPEYTEGMTGELSGLEGIKPNTDYAVVTASYDNLGTECEVRIATYTSPSLPLKGDPKVDIKLTESTQTSLSFEFKPNKDVNGYSYVLGEKGQLEKQYEQFAGMFGFANIGDMVKAWGCYVAHDEASEYTWKELEPNMDYEVFLQAWDAEEVAAPVQKIEARTARMGGSGDAAVDIKVTGYQLADWGGEMKPSLYISYTPNDQAGAYRIAVQFAKDYDTDPAGYDKDLCQDPEMPIAHWFMYGPVSTDYQVDPSTEVVIMAAAKNADGVWGKVNTVRYTTPAAVGKTAARAPRINSAGKGNMTGRVPVSKAGVRLIAK